MTINPIYITNHETPQISKQTGHANLDNSKNKFAKYNKKYKAFACEINNKIYCFKPDKKWIEVYTKDKKLNLTADFKKYNTENRLYIYDKSIKTNFDYNWQDGKQPELWNVGTIIIILILDYTDQIDKKELLYK